MGSKSKEMLVMGRLVVGPLMEVRSKHVNGPRAVFLKAQQALEDADRRVEAADRAVLEAGAAVAAADEVQDAAVLDLAVKLIGDGFNRTNPFKIFGAKAPSELTALGNVTEAKLLIALAAQVKKDPRAGSSAQQAATEMHEAAEAVREAAKAHSKALQARRMAVESRDESLPKQWQKGLSELRITLRYIDSLDVGSGTYNSVFEDVRPRSGKKKKSAPVEEPVI